MTFLKQFTFLCFHQIRLFHNCVRYKEFKFPVTNMYREKFKEILSKPEIPEEVWKQLRTDLLSTTKMKEFLLDHFIIRMCRTHNFAHAGIQYYKLLEKQAEQSPVLTAEYLLLYDYYSLPSSNADKEHILEKYKEISENYKMLNSDLANSFITALAKLDDTEECIKIIEQFEEYEPNEHLYKGYNAIIASFLKQGKIDLAYKYMTKQFKVAHKVSSNVYSAYITYCKKDKENFHARVDSLFKLWENYGIRPPPETVENFINACNQYGWSAQFTKLIQSICEGCGRNAFHSNITKSEYESLANHIMKRLVSDKGYEITIPREWSNFTNFLDEHGPYDIVIDALNVINTFNKKNKAHPIDGLLETLKYVESHKKKALVIGRLHLNKYKKQFEHYKNKIHFYFVSNISQDDQFALYAAVSGGKDAILISNDFMRQHKYHLDEIGTLFSKWQHFHQYTTNMNYRKLKLTPLSGSKRDIKHNINPCAQKIENYWHIAYLEVASANSLKYRIGLACFTMPMLKS